MPGKKDAVITIGKLDQLTPGDLYDLCDATEATLLDDRSSFSIGLNRSAPPVRERLESFWKGVLLVPGRVLIVGRLDGVIAASIQLVRPTAGNQTTAFSGSVDHHFVAPWARGYGLAKMLLTRAEEEAKEYGLSQIRFSIRANLTSAIALYESSNYTRWGTLDHYEMLDGKMLAGHFYYKGL